MEIRDILHGAVLVEPHELKVIDSFFFQRLRHIKQLGFSEYSFPGASHNRFVHSLGAMEVASQVFFSISRHCKPMRALPDDTLRRLRACLRLAALLHDIGHGPYSHTTEFAMPPVGELRIPGYFARNDRKATHEDYTLKIVLDSSLTPMLHESGTKFGFAPEHIAALIDPELRVDEDFFTTNVDNVAINFRPLLQQVISSELDADRMDYLRRDSLYAGVTYGQFDYDWIRANLTAHFCDGRAYLTLEHRALYAFEDFLISRFNMFLMVYFHHKGVVFDEMLARYFESSECDYHLPADIEAYGDCTDTHLFTHLAQSQSPWAKRITQKQPFRMLLEVHSGIPTSESSAREQEALVREIQEDLAKKDLPFLVVTSTGELSKYSRLPAHPIYVRYDNHYSPIAFLPLDKCTDLFQRYHDKRSITRIYVAPEDLARINHLR